MAYILKEDLIWDEADMRYTDPGFFIDDVCYVNYSKKDAYNAAKEIGGIIEYKGKEYIGAPKGSEFIPNTGYASTFILPNGVKFAFDTIDDSDEIIEKYC